MLSRMFFHYHRDIITTVCMTTPVQIRKRNGSFAPFEADKITNAISKAFFAHTGDAHRAVSEEITQSVLADLEAKDDRAAGEWVPSVEEVQDLVELAIMERGYFDVAKSYIVYRFQQHKRRETERAEVAEKIRHNALTVRSDDGSTEIFSLDAVRAAFRHAARGVEDDIDIDALVTQVEAEVYEGMTTREIAHALVLVARSFIERDPAYSAVASRLLLENIVYGDAVGSDDVEDPLFVAHYRQNFASYIDEAVKKELLAPEMLEFNMAKICAAIKPENDDLFRYLGTQTLVDRYFIRDKFNPGHTRYMETPQYMWMRVAMGLALREKNKEEKAIEFYNLYSSLRFVSSTPTLFHSGTLHPQLSSCYLGTVGDDLNSIFKTYSDCAQLSKYAGGIGWDWSPIRATGARVKGNDITSNGVIPFLKIQDSTTVAINRSGRRRGATAVYLETWHYDIEDFLKLRKNTGDDRRRTHELNTVNWIPDLFMQRVRDDGEWTLFSPDEVKDLHDLYGAAFKKAYESYEAKAARGEMRVWKKVQARTLWKEMITQVFETGHPWMTFKDACNVRSPQDHVGVVHNSNLCTEITLNTIADEETAVCNLGSINLARHMADGELDIKALEQTTTTAMRMLDNVIDINFYPTVESKKSNLRHRPVGLGIMGFQDALYMADINFDSDECVAFADYSMELISYHAIMASSELAKERGTYESYTGSKWDRDIFPVDTVALLAEERGEDIPVTTQGKLDWKPVREHVKRHGMRNSNCMALAPTATISNIAGCLPTIEPIYKNIYVKANISGEFTITNHYLIQDLKEAGLWNGEMLELIKGAEGDISHISSIPQRLKDKYKETFSIDPMWLIKAAAYRAKWIDQSQSLNVFFKGTSGKAISDLYQYAWTLGLKTTYYLRTLAASSVEKSTVSLEKQSTTSIADRARNERAAAAVAEVKKEVVAAPASVVASSPSSFGAAPKICKIDDPDCEACQ